MARVAVGDRLRAFLAGRADARRGSVRVDADGAGASSPYLEGIASQHRARVARRAERAVAAVEDAEAAFDQARGAYAIALRDARTGSGDVGQALYLCEMIRTSLADPLAAARREAAETDALARVEQECADILAARYLRGARVGGSPKIAVRVTCAAEDLQRRVGALVATFEKTFEEHLRLG